MQFFLHTIKPRLSGLIGTRRNSLDNWGSENMNINEEQNCLNQATFNHETTLLQIAWKTIWSTVHLEPLNSEPIRTHSRVLHWLRCMQVLLLLFKSTINLLLTALFNAIALKGILLLILIRTNKYSRQNWDLRKSPDNREIWIIEAGIIEVPLY